MLRRKIIRDCILDGINEAWRTHNNIYDKRDPYYKTVGENTIRNEQYYSSFINKELNIQSFESKDGSYATHETADFLVCCGVHTQTKKDLPTRESIRCDFVLWTKNSVPYAIGEVKVTRKFDSLKTDAIKLLKTISRLGKINGGTIRNVFFGIVIDKKGRSSIEEIASGLHRKLIKSLRVPTDGVDFKLSDTKELGIYFKETENPDFGAAVFRLDSEMLERI